MYEELHGKKLMESLRKGNIIGTSESPFRKDAYIVHGFYNTTTTAKRIGERYYSDLYTRIQTRDLAAILISEYRLEKLGFSKNDTKGWWELNGFTAYEIGVVWRLKFGEQEQFAVAIHQLQNFYFEVKGEDFKLPFIEAQELYSGKL